MRLAIFNGSPRGKSSNTSRLLGNFVKGFTGGGGVVTSYNYLIKESDIHNHLKNFIEAETILLAFPLYVDSLPGIVKNFIEETAGFDGKEKKILFLVHSGFPEGVHSAGVTKYLELLAKRWGIKCLGIIVKPGSEGIRIQSESKNKKLFQNFEKLGKVLAKTGSLDMEIVDKMKKPYRFPKFALLIFNVLKQSGKVDSYWNYNLKKNNVYEQRFNAPYLEKKASD
ncbi:MAG: NAD(P)H-dependent oxidoreductase [Bacteroidota bacterium]